VIARASFGFIPRLTAVLVRVGCVFRYKKLGFKKMPGLVREGVPPEVFFALPFDGNQPQGTVAFHEGFSAEGQHVAPGDG
jgi:predicted N-acetyltransferase YhbS